MKHPYAREGFFALSGTAGSVSQSRWFEPDTGSPRFSRVGRRVAPRAEALLNTCAIGCMPGSQRRKSKHPE